MFKQLKKCKKQSSNILAEADTSCNRRKNSIYAVTIHGPNTYRCTVHNTIFSYQLLEWEGTAFSPSVIRLYHFVFHLLQISNCEKKLVTEEEEKNPICSAVKNKDLCVHHQQHPVQEDVTVNEVTPGAVLVYTMSVFLFFTILNIEQLELIWGIFHTASLGILLLTVQVTRKMQHYTFPSISVTSLSSLASLRN